MANYITVKHLDFVRIIENDKWTRHEPESRGGILVLAFLNLSKAVPENQYFSVTLLSAVLSPWVWRQGLPPSWYSNTITNTALPQTESGSCAIAPVVNEDAYNSHKEDKVRFHLLKLATILRLVLHWIGQEKYCLYKHTKAYPAAHMKGGVRWLSFLLYPTITHRYCN